ncbi:hypothetical protein I6H91_06220 [Micrococcus luteus]|uniref:hypothetical protein n=1 Tax=Micrococcus luteus TaxID=1270 RepID=UPI0019105942|nr:hypothetical protein [Micrococcus luteus]QQE47795.1 hypothetical protein I6H91_06220 [Micrococcus luteus]
MTTGTDASYETRSIRAVRGMEARTIKKWEDDGWELVSQSPGKLRTEITLRRPKPRSRRVLWIIGAVVLAVVLAVIITIGVISERSATPAVVESPASTATAPAETSEDGSPSPTPSATVPTDCSMVGASADCTFGQTVIYTDTTRAGDVALEITVLDPVEFTPSDSATFWNSRAHEMPRLPVNIYFPVTIKNVADGARDGSFISTQATNDAEGESEVLSVSDATASNGASFDTLAPGETYEFNDGWSMSTLDGVEFEIRIDGLSGGRVTFTK